MPLLEGKPDKVQHRQGAWYCMQDLAHFVFSSSCLGRDASLALKIRQLSPWHTKPLYTAQKLANFNLKAAMRLVEAARHLIILSLQDFSAELRNRTCDFAVYHVG